MNHFLTTKIITKKWLEDFFKETDLISEDYYSKNITQKFKDKILISFFQEPSTRTRMSFESAMLHLSGKIITDTNTSSLHKGESIQDTLSMLSCYGDIIAFRHSDRNWVNYVENYAKIPVINAGNGNDEHPTQSLLDVYTIYKEKSLENIRILFTGDIKHGRTIHSLLPILKLYNAKVFIYGNDEIISNYENCEIISDSKILEDIFPFIDVLYITRIQKERLQENTDIFCGKKIILQPKFILNNHWLNILNNNAIIMHPLPRVNEISPEIDNDKRVVYLHEMPKNGLLTRITLLKRLLEN